MTWLRPLRALRSTAGTVALEYGLTVPFFLLMLFGGMDAGRAVWTYTTLQRSVEAAARCGAVNTTVCNSPTAIAARAVAEAWGLTLSPGTFTVTYPTCGASPGLRVTARYNLTLLIPWIDGHRPGGQSGTVTINVSACYPV
jgi:Flp pilus assembly protein TadG